MQKTACEKIKKARQEEARERLWENLTKGRSGIPGSGIPPTDFVNTRALLTQMRYIRYGGGQRPFNELRSVQICYRQQARRLDGGLSSSRGHTERPGWTVEHNRSRSNGNAYRLRSREEPESARLCVQIGKQGSWHPYINRSVFGVLTFCFAEFDTSVICHAVFLLCSGSFLLQNMPLNVGFQFEGRSLKYSVSMFQRKVDNWKPQAGGHVTGLCRRSTSGRNDLSLPLAALFFIFSRAVSCAAPY